MTGHRWASVLLVSASALLGCVASTATAAERPVKVYILAGQSNMVGIGQVTGGGSRWGDEFIDPVLSVYEGAYDPSANYDQMTPAKTVKLEKFGGATPTPYPGGGVQIVRGQIQIKDTGVYEFRPGYGGSTHNIMQVDGREVYRKEPGGESKHTHIKLAAGRKVPFKITYLTDDANGLGWIARIDIPGTLATVVRQDGRFKYLVDEDGNWKPRNDVWYRGVVTATANKWLSVGCGAGDNQIGPELGFGHVVGDYHDEPVLILKASQGNRSLGWDFLPPGSERFEHEGYVYAGYKDSPSRWEKGATPEPINWYAGKQYDDCFGAAHEVLKNFDKEFPHWKGRGYEIAGFAWWQGHKDQGNAAHAERYEQNLVHLIKTLRKEFNAPDAPFVIATIGFDGWKMDGLAKVVAEAQLAVSGDAGKYPQFKGNVKTVETRDFWRTAEQSPRNQGFHYNQNAETYMLVGEAMGKGMVELLRGKPVSSDAEPIPAGPTAFEVKPLTDEQAKAYALDKEFYKKGTLVQNIFIATSDRVSDYAHLESAYLFDRMMNDLKPEIAQRVRDRNMLCVIVAHDELTSDIPQFRTDKLGKALDFYNWRQRGFLNMGKKPHPIFLYAEEDVLEYEGGMRLESILIHEFGHVVAGAGFDDDLREQLAEAYANVKTAGIWNDGYASQRFGRVSSETPVLLLDALAESFPEQPRVFLAACLDGGDILVNGEAADAQVRVTKDDKVRIVFGGPKECYHAKNRAEYWAEGFQTWYDTNRTMDHDHNHIHTRAQLKEYDPLLAKLCEQVMGDGAWRFVSPRERAGKGHLAGYDPAEAPKVTKLPHIEQAALDYYDKYWKDYWKRLHAKHPDAAPRPTDSE